MFSVPTDDIQNGVLYQVIGTASVIYNGITYETNSNFRGLSSINIFEFTGDGTQEVLEVLELKGGAIEYNQDATGYPVFAEQTVIHGLAIEFALNDAEKIVNEVTVIKGFAIELIDFPFYSFEITETRF